MQGIPATSQRTWMAVAKPLRIFRSIRDTVATRASPRMSLSPEASPAREVEEDFENIEDEIIKDVELSMDALPAYPYYEPD